MAPRRATGEARAEADLDFERLYAGHRGEVFRAALRELGNVHDAEDVTQAAFIDAYRAVLRGSRPEAPRAWLLAIAENVRRRRFRTALRRPREEPLDPEATHGAEPTTEQTNALRSALAGLPPQQRAVFLLREIVGLSYDEIAEELGSTVGAIQMLLFRARQTLRADLEPPAVTRRGGIIVPLPGWLTGLSTRSDALVLTPRAAGALGAAVLAVTGVTAGLATSPTDAASPPVVHGDAPHARVQAQAAAVVVAQALAVPARSARRQAEPATSSPPKRQRTAVAPAPAAPATSTPEAPAHPTEARPGPAVAPPAHQLPPVTVVEDAVTSLPAPPTVSVQLPLPPVPPPPPPPLLPLLPTPPPPLPVPPLPPPPPLP